MRPRADDIGGGLIVVLELNEDLLHAMDVLFKLMHERLIREGEAGLLSTERPQKGSGPSLPVLVAIDEQDATLAAVQIILESRDDGGNPRSPVGHDTL
jgi:hypothetical protein